MGRAVIKVHWRRGDEELSSGFVLAAGPEEVWCLLRDLAERAGVAGAA